MDLQTLKNRVNELRAIAAVDLDSIPSSTHRYTAQGAKNGAQQKLEVLEPQLVEAILLNSRVIVVRDDVARNLDTLTSMADVVTLDFLDLEKKLVDGIYKNQGQGFTFDQHTQYQINNLLQDLFAARVNVSSMEQLALPATENSYVATRAEAVAKMHAWIDAGYEGELKQILLRHEMFEATKHKTEFDRLNFLITNVPTGAETAIADALGGQLSGTAVLVGAESAGLDAVVVLEDTTDKDLNGKLKKVFGKKGKKNE